jgi:hypothetical protein
VVKGGDPDNHCTKISKSLKFGRGQRFCA